MNNAAVIFTGQGSQRPGMAKDFCETFSISAERFDAASAALGIDMRELCFTENEQLNHTEFTQPAILTAEIAMFDALRTNFDFRPVYFAGHSLGEYTALVAAGVIPFEIALKIVRRRGALMQKAVPLGVGAMAALLGDVLASSDYLETLKECGVDVANYNSPAQTVISGSKEGVENACGRLKEQFPDLGIVFLNVSAPFHSSLMRSIEPEFEEYLNSFRAELHCENCTSVLSNFSGDFHCRDGMLNGLVRQISGSVQWLKNMQKLAAISSDIVEIGPSRVLSKFFSSLDVKVRAITDLRMLRKHFPKSIEAQAAST